jgi:GT2 family glycosyltransferase
VSAKVSVSIIIVNWNGASVLPQCLAALAAQTYTDFEVILVDNGSSDASLTLAQTTSAFFNLHIEKLPKNVGFAAANNIGAKCAQGQWLALLNTDAFPSETWLEKMLQAVAQQPDNIFLASQLIQANNHDLLDGVGDALHISGLAWRRKHGRSTLEPDAQRTHEVFSACAAAALYPRNAFLQVGGFDESFFSYHEDVDLAFRLRLRGLCCLYIPEAIVYHVGSATHGARSDFVIYHGHRNLVWSFIKNMPGHLLWLYLPVHIATNILFLLYYTLRGQGRAIWQAKIDALRGLSPVIQKRKEIQRTRQAFVKDIDRVLEHNLLAPFVGSRWRQDRT